MSREARAELESVQTRLRDARVAITTPSTPGFNEQREALVEELGPLREAATSTAERETFLENKALAAEGEVSALQIALRGEVALNDVGALPVVVCLATMVLGLMLAVEIDDHRDLLTGFELMVIASVPAFLLGLLMRLRIVTK